jgi:hypothetical protein
MSLHTDTYDLREEYDRLDEQVVEYASEYATTPAQSNAQKIAAQQGKQAERQRGGVAWALGYPDAPDRDGAGWNFDGAPEVTFSAITNGERHLLTDTIEDTGWSEQDAYVAIATADAPYLAHDPDAIDPEEFRETIMNVVELHPEFVAWAEARADEVSRSGDTGKSFLESAMEAADSTTSDETNG